MLKKSASGVLASRRGSTYRSVRLASSLTAALLDGFFEHPETILTSKPFGRFQRHFVHNRVFPQPVRIWSIVNGQWLMGWNPTEILFRRNHQPFTLNYGSCRR
jgi:hypothetical protein